MLQLIHSACGYDFYAMASEGKLLWNIVPAGSKAPTGAYLSLLAIATVKKVSVSVQIEVSEKAKNLFT